MAKISSPAKTPKLAQSKRVANVSNLIGEIRGIEADEERGRKFRALITKVVMQGSIEEGYFYAALRWEDSARTARSRVHGQPGVSRILAVCRDEFGDASGASLMRLRDRLSIRLDCEPAEVATMSLEDFLTAWKGGPGNPKTRYEIGRGDLATATPKTLSQAGADTAGWIHDAGDAPPEEFAHGALIGNRTALGFAILQSTKCPNQDKPLRAALQRAAKAKNPRLWLRWSMTGDDVEAYFKEVGAFQAAQIRLAEFPNRKAVTA